jgi:hypothetical protein
MFAAPAHAEAFGMTVSFQPVFAGIKVSFTEAGGALAVQKCTYNSVSLGGLGGLAPPNINKPFDLPAIGGTSTMTLPGIPTGTKWNVLINCKWAKEPAPFGSPRNASFSDIVTY